MKLKLSHVIVIMAFLVGVTGTVFVENARAANQPHMYAALDSLRNARGELNAAERDKGGHRTRAVELINQAIGEVKAGIAAGN